MIEYKQSCHIRSTKLLIWTILAAFIAVTCAEDEVIYDVKIVKTGDYKDVSFAEPYRITTLSLTTDDEEASLVDYDEVKWNVTFVPVEDEVWPEYQQEVLAEEVTGQSFVIDNIDNENPPDTLSHMFKLPGTYKVSVVGKTSSSSPEGPSRRQLKAEMQMETKPPKASKLPNKKTKKDHKAGKKTKKQPVGEVEQEVLLASSDIRVRYGRRDVIDLSPSDWDNYVEAIWTLRELSSSEGKKRFNCPNFYNLDVFTTMHGVLSYHPNCDQNHFSLMQENAHHAWMTLLEKALQCVHPTIAMPFYNIAKDKRKYYNPDVGAKSMLESPIFGPDYYGGGAANWDDRPDPYDPYYVEDGRFANFPLRQNRTELCDESVGLFNDDVYIPLCKSIMEGDDYKGWRNADPTKSGMWLREPRDDSHYKYVSARRWYLYSDVGDNFLPNFVPSHEMVHAMTTTENVAQQFMYVASAKIHGYAHMMFSGMWGGGIDETTLIPQTSVLNKGVPILETFRRGSGLLVAFAWTDELLSRDAGCYQCTKEGCTIDMENALDKNCYNINGGFGIPTDRTKPVWNENAKEGNFWYSYLDQLNQGSWMKFALYGYGTYHANRGTFGSHAWANQDPLFYAHHTFTFLMNDFGFKVQVDRGESPPLYGLDRVLEERGVPECPGHNPTDPSVYSNIVRYKHGQDVGTEQTWEHILEMWSEDRRDYEWIVNDEFITNYNETIRYDDSCKDGCVDEALVIFNAFPRDGSLTLEEMCQQFVGNIQQKNGLTKKEACATKLKDIPALGLPFLPWRFDLYSYSCKKTCNYCQATCGDIE